MARAFDDDLRRKFLAAYERGNASLRVVAERFGVSLGWAKKLVRQRQRNGRAERVPHTPGPRSRMTPALADSVRGHIAAQPDFTLAELQRRMLAEHGVRFSIGSLWSHVRRLGLRLKKSRSTPGSATPKLTGSGVRSTSTGSPGLRRKG